MLKVSKGLLFWLCIEQAQRGLKPIKITEEQEFKLYDIFHNHYEAIARLHTREFGREYSEEEISDMHDSIIKSFIVLRFLPAQKRAKGEKTQKPTGLLSSLINICNAEEIAIIR